MIPSGLTALSEGRFCICVLVSSRFSLVMNCGSGMGESEGWGESKSACTRVASSSSQGEVGCPIRSCPRAYLYWWYPCLPSLGSL